MRWITLALLLLPTTLAGETPEEREIRFADGLLERGFLEQAEETYEEIGGPVGERGIITIRKKRAVKEPDRKTRVALFAGAIDACLKFEEKYGGSDEAIEVRFELGDIHRLRASFAKWDRAREVEEEAWLAGAEVFRALFVELEAKSKKAGERDEETIVKAMNTTAM